MFMEILAWLTVVGLPVFALGLVAFGVVRYLNKRFGVFEGYVHTPAPPGWVQSETTTTTTATMNSKKPPKPPKPPKPNKSRPSPLKELNVEFPDITEIEESGWSEWENEESNSEKIVAPNGTRIYRIYRSLDQVDWVECDPALTERSACNYAQYIKMNNPKEFVRCNDPDGLILYYE